MTTTPSRGWLIVGTLLGVWLAAATTLSASGAFDRPGQPPLAFGLCLVLPIAALLGLYRWNTAVRTLARTVPLAQVTSVHVLRVVGVVFLLKVASEELPAEFGLPAGIGDLVAALWAAVLVVRLRRGAGAAPGPGSFVTWNLFGLLDLLVAVALGVLHSDSPAGVARGDVSTADLAHLPVSLIPTFYVPLLLVLHVLALSRARELRPTHQSPETAPTAKNTVMPRVLTNPWASTDAHRVR